MSAALTRPTAVQGWLYGVQLAAARLRWRLVLPIVFLAVVVVTASALGLRSRALIEAPSRALGVVFRWVVPLSTFALCALCVGRQRMDESVWPVAVHGVARRHLVLGVVTVAMLSSALVAALVTTVTLALAYGGMPGMATDLVTSAWIGALGATAYAAWFTFGSSFFRLGRGRWVPLVLDFTLGATGTVAAVVWPRAHLQNLAGGDALLDITQPTSSVVLAAMTVVIVCLAAMRGGD